MTMNICRASTKFTIVNILSYLLYFCLYLDLSIYLNIAVSFENKL